MSYFDFKFYNNMIVQILNERAKAEQEAMQ